METTIRIRRDADGATEEIKADVARAGEKVNVHLRDDVTLTKGDVLMIDEEVLTA